MFRGKAYCYTLCWLISDETCIFLKIEPVEPIGNTWVVIVTTDILWVHHYDPEEKV